MDLEPADARPGTRTPARATRWTWRLAVPACAALTIAAAPAHAGGGGICSRTAVIQQKACFREAADDSLTAKAVCINHADLTERAECLAEADEELAETRELCDEQLEARLEVCEAVGQGPYDPDWDPADFDDDFELPSMPNPFLPLAPGNAWSYAGGEETIEVEVLEATKRIEDVTCITVRDRAFEDGELKEDTDDWFAQALNGDVWYCGEISQNFELFEGDDPEVPELVDTEGSWKHGRDGAKAGLLIPKDGAVGMTYRQEWAPGDAEDVATIVSRSYGFGNGEGLDELVPEALAELLCDDDCMVTRESTPIEPGGFELKYYAPGVGLFLEVNLEDQEIVQLLACNVDPRCADLPELE